MTNATEKKDTRYKLVAVEAGKSIVMAYLPNDNYIHKGDEVELENGCRGRIMLYDDYKEYDSLREYEQKMDVELVKILKVWEKNEVEW